MYTAHTINTIMIAWQMYSAILFQAVESSFIQLMEDTLSTVSGNRENQTLC